MQSRSLGRAQPADVQASETARVGGVAQACVSTKDSLWKGLLGVLVRRQFIKEGPQEKKRMPWRPLCMVPGTDPGSFTYRNVNPAPLVVVPTICTSPGFATPWYWWMRQLRPLSAL